MMRFSLRDSIGLLAILMICGDVGGLRAESADWPWWRGPNHDGSASATQMPPLDWSAHINRKWTTPVPGKGHGSPCVCGEQVYLAVADSERDVQSILCVDRASGEIQWETVVHRGGLQVKNEKSSAASSTPACDGQRVYINFLNHGAVYTTALDITGKLLWQKKVSDYVIHQGFGSSPTLYKSLVLSVADNKGGGALVAFACESGEEVWRRDRPATANYPSPIVVHAAGRDQLIMIGCEQVVSYDPLTGETIWEIAGATTECVTSTVTDGTHIYTTGGYPRNHVEAIRADGSGRVAWELNVRVYVPSM
ncbi:MAG: PQQ-binding-like beta-propeller repeat protein, partial [Planctomycetales bacterium]|nr:PQQ-binding-like beta-propeller repeat protein [Planctomycetales bacterium]